MYCRKGFTLIEIILATLLLVVGVIAVVRTMSTALANSTYADGQYVALALAEEKMEDVKDSSTWASIADEAQAALTGIYAGYTREVDVTATAADLKQVTVNVQWVYKAQTITVSLVSYIANTFS